MTPESEVSSKVFRRISGPGAEWVMLADAFLYVWSQVSIDTNAKIELARRLEKGEILSRAVALKSVDRKTGKILEEKISPDLPSEFWHDPTKLKVEWSENWAHGGNSSVLERATGIQVRREDIFRIWPPAQQRSAETAPQAQPAAPKRPPSKDELLKFALSLPPHTIEDRAHAAADAHFLDHHITKRLWRAVWKAVPQDKKRGKGDNERTLKSRSTPKSPEDGR